MPSRGSWKGYLKLSLVTCPVAMLPATSEAERVRFHTLNRATGNRVRSRYVDAVSGEAVASEDEVKGFATGPDEYVVVEDEELEAVGLDSGRTIDIESFVPDDSIDRIWLDTPHFLMPDDPVGEEAFAVIREGMLATRTFGLSRLVLYRRERSVLVRPYSHGMVLWTLRFADEVRRPDTYFAQHRDVAVPPEPLQLAESVIAERLTTWDKALFHDRLQKNLVALVAARRDGRKRPRQATPQAGGAKVINIMDALKRSLAQDKVQDKAQDRAQHRSRDRAQDRAHDRAKDKAGDETAGKAMDGRDDRRPPGG